MEISRQQFLQKLPEVEKAIKECDFMAIDTELSGEYGSNASPVPH
jgi:chaperonin cofactor prefoldin